MRDTQAAAVTGNRTGKRKNGSKFLLRMIKVKTSLYMLLYAARNVSDIVQVLFYITTDIIHVKWVKLVDKLVYVRTILV